MYICVYFCTSNSAASLVIFFFANKQNCFLVKETGIVGFLLLAVLEQSLVLLLRFVDLHNYEMYEQMNV